MSRDSGYTYKGKSILLQKKTGPKPTGLVAMGIEKGIYPEEKRIEVTTLYAALGDVKKVAELTDVPASTIKNWRKQLWFYDLLQEIREENNEKIDANFNEIIETALFQLLDRVKNGDFVFNAKMELVRRPLSGKDLSAVAAINIDKRQLLRGEPTSRSESVSTEDEKALSRVEKLAETFESLAKKTQIKAIAMDVPSVAWW